MDIISKLNDLMFLWGFSVREVTLLLMNMLKTGTGNITHAHTCTHTQRTCPGLSFQNWNLINTSCLHCFSVFLLCLHPHSQKAPTPPHPAANNIPLIQSQLSLRVLTVNPLAHKCTHIHVALIAFTDCIKRVIMMTCWFHLKKKKVWNLYIIYAAQKKLREH